MRPNRSSVSCVFQPLDGRLEHAVEARDLLFQVRAAGAGDAVGLPPVVRVYGTNPAALFQAGDGAKLIAGVVLAPQCESKNGNIVDRAGLDQRLRNSRRYAIKIGVELAV